MGFNTGGTLEPRVAAPRTADASAGHTAGTGFESRVTSASGQH
jgi:hypothetical protein